MNNNALEVLQQEFVELAQWLKPLCRYGKIEDFVIIDHKEGKTNLKFYTKDHKYCISAVLPGVRDKEGFKNEDGTYREDNGYLGCVGQTRKPRAGEDWTRGNDLPDGPYTEETWDKIIHAIIAYELVKVVKQKNRGAYLNIDEDLLPANDSSIKQNYKNK